MGLLDFQSIEWTPAACFLALQTSLVVLEALNLIAGQTDGFYKMQPHTKKISSRPFEVSIGGHLLYWGAGMMGALVAGGAHVMCILQLPPMLGATYYHYASGGKPNVIMNCVFMVPLAYFGFVPMPTFQPIEWTPATYFLVFQLCLILPTAAMFLMGKTDSFYQTNAHVKEIMSRHGELMMGSLLLGIGAGTLGAVIAGGAQDMCILALLPVAVCTYCHFAGGPAGRTNGIVNSMFLVAFLYFGFVR